MKLGKVKKNLLIALSGTALAQLIHLLFTPVLTRMYSPEEFGALALLISLSGLVTALATAKYDFAIVIAPKDERSYLDRAIFIISTAFMVFLALVSIALFFYGETQSAIICIFLSLMAFFRAKYQSKRAILNSFGQYSSMAQGKVIENSSNGLIAVLLSLLHINSVGLMIAKTLSFLLPSFFYQKKASSFVEITKDNPIDVMKKHINFPKYSIASELLTQINLGFSIFAFTYLYGQEVAGHISMTTRVLSLPINFIGLAFLDVFREKATSDYNEHQSFRTIFIKFLLTLSSLAFLGFLTISIWGEELFITVLGNQWQTAGEFAAIAILLYSIRLVSSPLSFTYHLAQKQNIDMLFKLVTLIVSFASIAYASSAGLQAIECLKYYCFSLSLVHILYIVSAFKYTHRSKA